MGVSTKKVQSENEVIISPNKLKLNKSMNSNGESADFETAAAATKFGLFNLILFFLLLPSSLTNQVETTSMAYVLPLAQCDLHLSLGAKGVLNSMIYAGMCISGLLVGFMSDIFGRRNFLAYGYLIHVCVTVLTASAPSFTVLLIAKLIGGFVINGPACILATYIGEFHAKKYRSRVPLTIGLCYNWTNMVLPLMAWLVLPMKIELEFFGGSYVFHAWNLYLLLGVIPALIAGLSYLFMPETPKFLMTKGDNEDALKIFAKIYAKNTRKPQETYPIKKLIDERDPDEEKKKGFKNAVQQILPLFRNPHLTRLVLSCTIIFLQFMTINSMRFWLPHIFQTVNDYQYSTSDHSGSFCQTIESIQSDPANETASCNVNYDNSTVYVNMIIVGVVTMCGYVATGTLINKLGKKKIVCLLSAIAGMGAIAIYFAPNITVAIVLICINMTSNSVCIDVMITAIIDLFPTSLRSSALTLSLLWGRLASVIGSIIFPYLLGLGCGPPFFTIGFIMIACGLLSFILPNTDQKDLE